MYRNKKVKIGYADDMDRRLKELNKSECIPFAFRVYATYEVDTRLSDKKIHTIIDKLNPNLRSIDTFNGQQRVREFYAMSPEDAYSIFEAIAQIHACENKLKKVIPDSDAVEDEQTAEDIICERRERLSPFSFSLCQINAGEELEFWPSQYVNSGKTCIVIDEKRVKYSGEVYSLSSLAQLLLGAPNNVAGPRYFKYQGEWLNDIRRRITGV